MTLVGAGPGDPALMTLGGRAALQEADVVLYDHLVGDEVLAMIPPGAARVPVGKRSGRHTMPQSGINGLILEYALAGKRVVRLKGGDPYLFGRGAEELEALAARGIPFRVVPGVTSALAAPAYAGIPVTHRDYASSLHILTGHARAGRAPDIDYGALSRLGGTLVFLMGVSALQEISAGLMAAGMPGETPAALIHRGTCPEQRALTAPLGDIAARARAEGMEAPAALVVGRVCALGDRFDFTRHLPLWGRRFVVASAGAGGRLAARLRAAGAAVDECALIGTRPLPMDAGRLCAYQWIALTSARGAEALFDAMRTQRVDVRALAGVRFAAVGPETARAVEARGVLVDYVPAVYDGAHLGEGLALRMRPGERALVARAREGAPELSEAMRRRGADLDEWAAYEALDAEADVERVREALKAGRYQAAAFTSGASVDAFARRMAGADLSGLRAVCIGETTAARARAHGMDALVSPVCNIEGMAKLMESEGRTWT